MHRADRSVHREDVRGRDRRIQAYIVALAPSVARAAELIGDRQAGARVEPERVTVEPDGSLPWLLRIQVYYHKNRVGAARLLAARALGEAQDVGLITVVEPDVAQPVQRRVRAPDFVQPGEEWSYRHAQLGRPVPVAGPVLVLLRVQVFLAARHERNVLAEL